jgi:hypothetical protein
VPPAEHVPTTLTTVVDDPSPTPTTTNQDRGEATVEGEVASRREPPRRVQVDHPASRIIGDMNERTTRSRVRNNSHFAHTAFVATFHYMKTSNRSRNICNGTLTPVTSTHICNGCCLALITYKHARTTPGLASTTPVTNVDFW